MFADFGWWPVCHGSAVVVCECGNGQGIRNADAFGAWIALQNGARNDLFMGHGLIKTAHTRRRNGSVVEHRLPLVCGLLGQSGT